VLDFFSAGGTKMFQFPPFASSWLLHSPWDPRILLLGGCPIRTHPGQRSFGSSPDSFVAYTVLLRQHVPRHPPRALSRLSISSNFIKTSTQSEDQISISTPSSSDSSPIRSPLILSPVLLLTDQTSSQSTFACYTYTRIPEISYVPLN
jgi:hypothetical protein